MSFWTAVVIIVAISGIVRIVQARHGISPSRRGGHDTGQADRALIHENEALKRELQQMRERLEVLERIATDANSSRERQTRALADEIESLRDS